jgi:MFS family permease
MPSPDGDRSCSTMTAPAPTSTPSTADDPSTPYGWVIVATVFVMLAVTSGIGFYNASVILSAATTELDASVGAVSGATGLFFAISGLSGFLLSRWMDTADLRWFFAAGGIIGAIALFGLRWVTSVPALYVFFALFGVGFGLAGLVPSTTLVTRWFDRRRSVALSIASTGLSIGGIALTPIAVWIITRNGLSNAGIVLAAVWLVGIVPIAMLLVRPYPPDATDDRQVASDRLDVGSGGLVGAAAPKVQPGATFAVARGTRFFRAVAVAYALIFFGQVGGIAQLFNMVRERTDETTAATAVSTIAFASVVARLIGGVMVMRIPVKPFTAGMAAVQGCSLVLLALAGSSTALIASAAVFGIGIGNLLMLQPLLLAEAFGVANYSRIYSFSQLAATIGVATGPLILGVLRDGFDYRIAFMVAAGASLAGLVSLLMAGPSEIARSLWST